MCISSVDDVDVEKEKKKEGTEGRNIAGHKNKGGRPKDDMQKKSKLLKARDDKEV